MDVKTLRQYVLTRVCNTKQTHVLCVIDLIVKKTGAAILFISSSYLSVLVFTGCQQTLKPDVVSHTALITELHPHHIVVS